MENEMFDYWTKVANATLASCKDFADIQSKAFESVIGQQQALFGAAIEAYSAQVKLASDAKGYKELLAGQAKLLSEQGEKVLAITRNTTGTLESLKGDLTSWMEKGIESTRVMTPVMETKPVAPRKAA
jgi:phasin family protein